MLVHSFLMGAAADKVAGGQVPAKFLSKGVREAYLPLAFERMHRSQMPGDSKSPKLGNGFTVKPSDCILPDSPSRRSGSILHDD